VFDERDKTLDEAVMAFFTAFSQRWLGGTDERPKVLNRLNRTN
jgi:hypothetical protein